MHSLYFIIVESKAQFAYMCTCIPYSKLLVSDFHDQLAGVAAGEQQVQCVHVLLHRRLADVLLEHNLALSDSIHDLRSALFLAGRVVPAQEALHFQATHEDILVVLWPRTGVVLLVTRVRGDGAAEGNAAEAVHLGQHDVQNVATDVVEVAINALGTQRTQLALHVAQLVVHGTVKAQFLHEHAALRGAACDADDTGTCQLRELSREGTHRTCRATHHVRVSWLDCADFVTNPGSVTHTKKERPEVPAQGNFWRDWCALFDRQDQVLRKTRKRRHEGSNSQSALIGRFNNTTNT